MALSKTDIWQYIIIILIGVASLFRLFSPTLNSIGLYVIIPLLFIILIAKHNVFGNKCVRIYTCIIIWIIITCFTAINTNVSFEILKTYVGTYAVSIVVYSIAANYNKAGKGMFFIYILLLFSTLYYLYTTGDLVSVNIESERLNPDSVNANDLAYYLFFNTVCISVLCWQWSEKNKKVLTIIIYIGFIVISVILALVTASRQILVFVIPFEILSLYFCVNRKLKIGKGTIVFIIVAVVLYFIFQNYFSSAFSNSFLMHRMDKEHMTNDSRIWLIQEGFRVGFEYPIFGIGVGNINIFTGGAFSHCSFSEIFAATGIVGLLLLLLLFYHALKDIRPLKMNKDPLLEYLYIATWFFVAYNIFYVFYSSPWLMAFFFLTIGTAERIKYQIN